MENDKGHVRLMSQVEKLLEEVKAFKFHDFKTEDYGAPKMVLAEKFRNLRKLTLDGEFDN